MFNINLLFNTSVKVITLIILAQGLYSCKSDSARPSLADIDVKSENQAKNKVFIKPKSEEEIRKAYANYLKNSGSDDNSRIDALSRLAELEFDYSNKLLRDKEKLNKTNSDAAEDALYEAQLDKTINLLKTAINDYPKAKNNDTLLYQLAKAYDQKGEHQESIDTLVKLVKN